MGLKLQEPENSNYAAVVVKIVAINQLEGCDNVVGVPLFGMQAIVGKDTKVGDMGLIFSPETQLSLEYAAKNNLHRHNNLNVDETKKGYLEDNRRVKAMKFRGHPSNSLFMPLESLGYIKKFDISQLKEGDTFDKIGDHEICKKFFVKRKSTNPIEKNKLKVPRIDEGKYLPQHYDTSMYYRNHEAINDKTRVVVTQKLHGTSVRIGNTIVNRKLTLQDKLAKKVKVKVKETEFDYVFGSRRKIIDVNNPNQDHFYETDIWSEEGKKLEGLIPENFLVYGELIGYTPDGSTIQKNYTYKLPQGTCELYIYRIAFVNGQGLVVDLHWDQLKEFCKDRGLKYVPELWRGRKRDLVIEDFVDKRFYDEGYGDALPLEDDKKLVDEGVCVRVDGLAPYILKAKSPIFYEHETKMNDQEVVDLETVGSEQDS